MRYTKTALLAFGCGLLLGLVVIAGEIKSLQHVVSRTRIGGGAHGERCRQT